MNDGTVGQYISLDRRKAVGILLGRETSTQTAASQITLIVIELRQLQKICLENPFFIFTSQRKHALRESRFRIRVKK